MGQRGPAGLLVLTTSSPYGGWITSAITRALIGGLRVSRSCKRNSCFRTIVKLSPAGSWGPGPVAYLGQVLEVLSRVGGGPCDRCLALGDQGWDAISQARAGRFPGAPQGLGHQVVAAHAVEYDHVERGRRRALLVEAADVEPLGAHVAVDDLVDGPLVSMEGEDDRFVCCEELDEARLVHPVRVELAREERHQVDYVDNADLEFWRIVS